MSNTQQNNIQNEIQQIDKEMNLLQDKLKKPRKKYNFKIGYCTLEGYE